MPQPITLSTDLADPAVPGAIETPGSADQFSFTATVGEAIFVDFQSLTGGLLDINPVEVQAAATFYTMYNVISAVGRYHIQVCQNISCTLLDAEQIIGHLEKSLGIKSGQTTADGKFSLTTVECLGSCGTAPMMQINDDYYENLTAEKVDRILETLK